MESFLKHCVDSLVKQTHTDLEIILVNDGSRDNSGAICDEYAKTDERIKVIHKKNNGVGSARNAGMDIAKGEWVGFVDPDDWLEPEMYTTLLHVVTKYKSKIATCNRLIRDNNESGRLRGNIEPMVERLIPRDKTFLCILRECRFEITDKLFNLEFLRKNNLRFEHGIHPGEDILFIFQSLTVSQEGMACTPDALYNYRIHGDSAMYRFHEKRMTEIRAWEETLKIIKQHSPKDLSLARARYFYSLITLTRVAMKHGGERYLKRISKKAYEHSLPFFTSNQLGITTKIRCLIILLFPKMSHWMIKKMRKGC